jgi:O-antigen/teichoic acid export membrane protein
MTALPEAPAKVGTPRFGIGRVHRDAAAMAISSVANAGLGVGFWAFAAKFVTPVQLGVMTAVLAVIVSVGNVVAVGVGDAYTALLPAVGPARTRVYRNGQRVFFTLTAATGVLGALGTTLLLAEVRGSVTVAILVAVGIFVWASFTLQNSTMMAVGRAAWVPTANIVLGLAKIALLAALSIAVGWHSVELAVVIATAGIVLVMQPVLGRIIATGKGLPTTATISAEHASAEFKRVVVRTIALSAMGIGVVTLTPFLVTVFAGPSDGALFALSFSIVATFDYIAAAMAVSLVVHASSEPDQANAMARGILVRAAALTVVGTTAVIAVVPSALQFLNPEYDFRDTLAVVAVLCAATICRVGYIVWAALQQARRNLRMPLIFNAVTAVVMLASMPVLCGEYGAVGGALAVLVHQIGLSAMAGVHFVIANRRRRAEQA